MSTLLHAESLEHRLEPEDAGVALWVERESELERARELLEAWQSNPSQERFVAAEARVVEVVPVAAPPASAPRAALPGWVTVGVVLASVVVTAFGVGSMSQLPASLFALGDSQAISWALVDVIRTDSGEGPRFLDRIRAGEVWRLWTPIFAHTGGVLQLLFHGGWMMELGRQIENRRGSLPLLAMVLCFGIVGNLSQYLVGWMLLDVRAAAEGRGNAFAVGPLYLGEPTAGGLAGVVYGLFGYLWAKSMFAKFEGVGVPSSTVGILLFWTLVSLSGAAGPVGNVALFAGLIAGVLWGASSLRIRRPF